MGASTGDLGTGVASISADPVMAVLRASSTDRVGAVVEVLTASGIDLIEITLTTPGALDTLAALVGDFPDVTFGVGTVRDGADARAASEAGAAFLVTPTVEEEVLHDAAEGGVPVVCGAMTPTEILRAWRLGAAAVKVFPAGALGPSFVRAIRGPLPQVPLVPTGGVALDDIAAYLAAGAAMVGLGGPLIGDALEGGDLTALRQRAAHARRQARPAVHG